MVPHLPDPTVDKMSTLFLFGAVFSKQNFSEEEGMTKHNARG